MPTAKEELQTIYDGMVDGLLVVDLETMRFVRVNASMCRLLGYSESELLALTVADIHPPEVAPRVVQRLRAQQEGLRCITANRLVLRKDGTVFFADISNIRIQYNGRPCIVALFRDVTERKQAEAAIQQNRDELQAIYDGMTDALVILNAETKFCVRANRAMCDLLGYTEAELMALPPVALHPPERLPELAEKHEQLARGLIPQAEDIPFVRKDGRLVYVDVRMSPINYNGQRCLLSLFHDVTERRQAQEQLQKEHRTLKHLLQSSDHERQLIAYEIHDGLAQQLAGAIMQFQTYAYQKEAQPQEAANAFDAAMTMLKQGHFEARRLIAGVRPPILDEAGVVAAVGHLVHEQSRQRGPKINYHSEVDFDRLAPTLENSIYRIAQEALMNACRHSQSDRVKVSLLQRGPWVRIAVRDWGVGFDANDSQENRFGLVGIRQRARLLGGRCSIQSRPGQGARIIVDLPVVPKH